MTYETADSFRIPEPYYSALFEALPGSSILVQADAPKFTVLAATPEYLVKSGYAGKNLIGRGLFEAFPANHADPEHHGDKVLLASFQHVLQRKTPHFLPKQRYDLQNDDGSFIEKYWEASNKPVFSPDGKVAYIIHTAEDITGQVNADALEKRMKGMEMVNNLFMQTPVPICIVEGPELIVALANRPILELWGKSKVVIGLPLEEAFPEVKGQGYTELIHAVRETGIASQVYESPVTVMRNGKEELSYINFVYEPYYEVGHTKPVGVLAIGHDVTDKVLAKKTVDESEARYRTLFDSMDQGVCVLEIIFNTHNQPVDYRFLETNARFEKQTGLKDAIGKTARQLVPELEPHWFELYGKVALSGEAIHLTEGSAAMGRWFDVFAYRIGDQHSRKVALLFTDITERKKAGEAIAQSEQRFQNLVREAPIGIILLSGKGLKVEVVNESYARLIRRTAQELYGRELFTVIPEAEAGFRPVIEGVLRSGEPLYLHDTPYSVHIDNKKIEGYLNLVYQPYKEVDGTVSGVMVLCQDVTAQVAAGREKEEARQELQFVTDTMPQLVWATEANGYSYFFNKGWLAYTGLSLEEVRGNGWMQSLHPDDKGRAINAWTHAYKDGGTYEVDYRLKRHDGVYRWFLARGNAMKDEQGRIIKWYGSTTDVHDQKMAEEALRESEERFRTMVNAVPQSIWITDAEGRTEFLNKHWCDYSGESYSHTTVADIANKHLHPEDAPKVVKAFNEAMRSGEAFEVEQRNRSWQGEYRWFLNRGTPYRDSKTGHIIKWIGIGVDIHDRKLAEQALRKSEEALDKKVRERTEELESQKNLLNNILVNSSNGISVTEMVRDEKGNIIDAVTILANDAAVNFTGLPKEIYLSKKATELDPGVFQSPYGRMCMETLRTGEPSFSQYFLEITGRWLELTISRMDDEHLIHIFTDVTPIKEAQLQLERSVEELKRSNENLEEFAYAASHDLKEPIRKIHFFADRLKHELEDELSETQLRLFGRLENASRRMGSLIEDLLAYSQATRGIAEKDNIDLNKKIQLVLEDLELEIQQKNAQITLSPLPAVKGDKRQMQQLFQNLISNALKYSKPGMAPEVQVTAKEVMGKEVMPDISSEEAGKAFYLIEVCDNGIGFEQEDAQRIFNVFTRLHGMAEYRGTGVGLSIAQKVVQNHGGYIWAESKPGEGATFRVLLPAG